MTTNILYMLRRDQMTRHLFYLQLRRDMLEDRLQCAVDQATKLAALALQAEYGDHDNPALINHGYFLPEHYLPPRLLRSMGTANARDMLPSLHEAHQGLLDLDVETMYIKVCIMISYSMWFYIFLYF